MTAKSQTQQHGGGCCKATSVPTTATHNSITTAQQQQQHQQHHQHKTSSLSPQHHHNKDNKYIAPSPIKYYRDKDEDRVRVTMPPAIIRISSSSSTSSSNTNSTTSSSPTTKAPVHEEHYSTNSKSNQRQTVSTTTPTSTTNKAAAAAAPVYGSASSPIAVRDDTDTKSLRQRVLKTCFKTTTPKSECGGKHKNSNKVQFNDDLNTLIWIEPIATKYYSDYYPCSGERHMLSWNFFDNLYEDFW